MARLIQCPNCRQKVDDDNTFCIFCGTKLPKAAYPTKDSSPASSGSPPGAVRKCSHCHSEFDDPDLSFCPECGMPFEDAVSRKTAVMPACTIPAGMYLPTDEDLRPKRTR